jgi:MoaA/NifB/PqqE/SkfB family radical SAM enzyme
MKEISDTEFKEKNLVDLYRDIYATLIRKNILTLEQVEEEGISSYAGYACNQFISGMFIRKDGQAQACPGNDSAEFLYARDVRKDSLKEIWRNSAGYKIREKLISEGKLTLNQPCYAKSEEIPFADGRVRVRKGHGSIPEGFYEKVLQAVREKIAKEILLTEPESDSK